MIKWISVEDKLPKEGQRVVAVGIPDNCTEYTSCEIRYWDKVKFISNNEFWIPLPEPPIHYKTKVEPC
jgi:hypothetical protein